MTDAGAQQGTTTAERSSGRSLPTAIAVGVLLAALMIAGIVHSPEAFIGVVGLLAIIGIVETGRTFGAAGRPVATPVLLVALFTALFGTYHAGTAGQVVGLVVLFLGAVLWELAAHERDDVVGTLGGTMFLGLWTAFMASYAVLLATRPNGWQAGLLAVLGGVILGDIGGYAFGSLFGRHRIAPSISPNKTWEGLVGGLVLAAVGAWFALPLLGAPWDADPLAGVLVALAAAVAGFVGDLAESMVKRDLGVKDLGRILPGHGGVLDRVDGILVALPVGYYAVSLLT